MARCSGGVPMGLWRGLRVLSAVAVGSWREVLVACRWRLAGSRVGLASRKSRCSTLCREKPSTRSWRRVMCRMERFEGVQERRGACAFAAGVRAVGRLLRC